MNIFRVIEDFTTLMQKGKAIKFAGFLTNVEASASALYGVLSASVTLLKDLGYDISVQGSDLYSIANGWTATAAVGYSIWRIVSNPEAGKGVADNG